MGFSKRIKEKILVDTARHCCACHRYKGVKVEVHHIEQEALGGENTYENAISLCFDCHADAGHYNPNHPRGTKFSPAELKKAKENWIKIVKQHDIQEPTDYDKLLCRYFVCESYENLVEIYGGDLTSIPVTKPLLIENEILNSLGRIINSHPESYRHASIWGESLNNKEEYFKRHPDARITDKSTGELSYFTAVRIPSLTELENIKHKDGLLRLMMKDGDSAPEACSIVTCYEDACAGIELQEEYVLRNIWGGFVAITNVYDHPLALDSISGKISNESGFSNFSFKTDNSDRITLPKMAIEPGSTVLIPIAIIIPPIKLTGIERWSTEVVGEFGNEQIQEITRASINPQGNDDYLVYGGQININSIKYREGGSIKAQNIHAFDLTNMYLIDKCWQCGSCPHLFLVGKTLSYKKELLAHCQSVVGEESFIVPSDISSIIIAEIEDEVTHIDSITINGELYLENIVLKKFEYIEANVPSGAVVNIVGKYTPYRQIQHRVPQGAIRNKLVGRFICGYKNRPSIKLEAQQK